MGGLSNNSIVIFVLILCLHDLKTPLTSIFAFGIRHHQRTLTNSKTGLEKLHLMQRSADDHYDSSQATHSPCKESLDQRFGGILVNCSSMNLKKIDPAWLSLNATTILLDNNDIHTLCNDTFMHLKQLRVLSIRSSKVSRIQVNALRGLSRLEQLNMEYNNLPLWKNAFPLGMFNHVHNLLQLFIAFNNDETSNIIDTQTVDSKLLDNISPYPDCIDIFDHLPKLQSLSIDTFPNTLYLGTEFEKFSNLTSLVLFCGATTIVRSDSLIGLANVTLRHLEIREFVHKDLSFDLDVFQYLSHLKSLTVHQCRIGNHNILRALWPFQNRTLNSLNMHGTNYPHHYFPPKIVFEDGIIYKSKDNPLSSICVAHFAWTSSRLYAIQPESLSSSTWIRCLVSADWSSNPLQLSGWQSLTYVTTRSKLLEKIVLLMPDDTPTHPNSNAWLRHSLENGHDNYFSTLFEEEESPVFLGDLSVSHATEYSPDGHELMSQGNISYINGDMIVKNITKDLTAPPISAVDKEQNIYGDRDEIKEGENGPRKLAVDDFSFPEANENHSNGITLVEQRDESEEVENQGGSGVSGETQSGTDIKMSESAIRAPDSGTDEHFKPASTLHTPSQILATAEILQQKHNQSLSFILPIITIRLPPSLRSIQLDAANNHNFLHITKNIYIANGGVLEEVIARNMPMFVYGSKRLIGCVNLKFGDFTNTLIDVEDYFWDDFASFEVLIVSAIKPANFFERIPCKRLIRNMTNLRHLDISNNRLNLLAKDTFSSANKLQYLSLAKNRFSNIPFDLQTTPNLEVLDITDNALLFLTEAEMVAIDTRVASGKGFTLKLQGNGIVCVCSRIRFLAWQQTTLAHFDNDGNYSCTSEDGQLAFTKDFGDILGFWRQCEGRFMLMVSLVLASLLVVAMLTAYLTTRFRTAMVAFFLRVVAPHFRPQTISDYKTGVFVGYADDDYRFVRFKLQQYVEDGLKVSMFIHQRDLGAGYKDQLFYEAIQNSWRILLVITDNFLYNYDMANIIMKYASYSVSPVNRDRVLVLVEEAHLHNIPDFLHAVLDDTKIIPLTHIDAPLGYHHKQAIKNSVLLR